MSEKVEVQIRRKREKNHIPTKIMNDSKRAIGSVLKNKRPLGIKDKATEKELLCRFLGIDEQDPSYGDQRDRFWREFRLLVPMSGVVLTIAQDGNGNYLNMEDGIAYEYLKDNNHPLVATSERDMIQSPRKEFYIYDPISESKRSNVAVQFKKKAFLELAKIAEQPEKTNILIRLLLDQNPDSMTDVQKENMLSEFIDDNAKKFVDFVTDPDLKIRAEVESMVEKGILRKQGSSYLYMDSTIGDNIAEAISYMKNDRNSSVVADLKAKLRDIA